MKAIHLFFLLLKVAIVVQFVLIIMKIETVNARTYIMTEIIFKTSLGIFIEYFLYTTEIKGLLFEDKMIFSFAGGLLMYDAFANDLPRFLARYNVNIDFPFFSKAA